MEMEDIICVNIAEDFSDFPAGRHKKNDPYSGEEFRERFLLPHLKAERTVYVDFSGVYCALPGFLEEAFGGLVRAGITEDIIKNKLILLPLVVPSGDEYGVMINPPVEKAKNYIDNALAYASNNHKEQEKNHDSPTHTTTATENN